MLTLRDLSIPLRWTTGDAPRMPGVFYDGSEKANLLGATIRYLDNINDQTVETLIGLLNRSEIDYIIPEFENPVSGQIYLAGLVDSLATAALDGGINATVLTLTIKSPTGTIPDSGWCLINSEWMQYTKVALVLTITRGEFQTTAASHSDSDTIVFSGAKESVSPVEYGVMSV